MYDVAPPGNSVRRRAPQKIRFLHAMSLNAATTVEECLGVYRRLPQGSKLRGKALKKAFGLAMTVDEFLEVYHYDNSPVNNSRRRKALIKALSLASTIEEYQRVYDQAPGKSNARQRALIQIEALLMPLLNAATTVDEYRYVYDRVPDGSEVWRKALIQIEVLLTPLLNAATTVRECLGVHDRIPVPSGLRSEAFRKALSLIGNVEDCLTVLNRLSDGSIIQEEILEKALGLATTIEELRAISALPFYLGDAMLGKAEALLPLILEAATTFAECSEVYHFTLKRSEIHGKTLEKALGLATTVAECRAVLERSVPHSPLAYMAIRRMGELLEHPPEVV